MKNALPFGDPAKRWPVPASQLLPQFPNATVDALTVTQIRQGKDFRL